MSPDGRLEYEIVTPVQPYAARKRYLCPGCEGFIEAGEGHVVVVPEQWPDLRRHWHRACWHLEQRRRHGAGRPASGEAAERQPEDR